MNQVTDANLPVDQVLASHKYDPNALLQILIDLQAIGGWLPPEWREQVAQALKVPRIELEGVAAFYSFLRLQRPATYEVLVSDNITDRMLGNTDLINRLCSNLSATIGEIRSDGRVRVATTSCTGMCDQGPAALINGRVVTRLNTARVDEIARLIDSEVAVEQWPSELFEVSSQIQVAGPTLCADFDNGQAIQAALQYGPAGILDELGQAKLRGHGGAGFVTANKWQFCRNAPGDEKIVVCNADEGEPGTFKDRVLLHSFADRVFEGMTVCAHVLGARKGFLYLRGEYAYLCPSLESVLSRRRAAGLLGRNVGGCDGFDFDIQIHLGAGAYICGEESALIESLEGHRGVPRIRPPFPVTSGYRHRPTVVNNVETFANVARIAVQGGATFGQLGTAESTGTKVLSVSGDCTQPGLYEYPFGVTVSQVLADCGGSDAQAVQIAGAAGTLVPASEFHRRIAYEDLATGGSFMVLGPQRDVLDAVRNFAHFFAHESCGFCTPCRVGTSLVRDLVEKVFNGHGTQADLDELRRIGELMQRTSHCGLGQTAANPILQTLDQFPQAWLQRLSTTAYEPSFDLDQALSASRRITGRHDAGSHI
ncbi:MAG: NAD(P)H-dependent oxidoreductase subunit E [Pseudomonadota bacterium]|nr:NAD(P)H-dependent oxidoreductase subunit E [Pseudomonadota bacterium]